MSCWITEAVLEILKVMRFRFDELNIRNRTDKFRPATLDRRIHVAAALNTS